MIRPWNWSSRWDRSLFTVVMSTVNAALVIEVPTIEAGPIFHVPASGALFSPATVVGGAVVAIDNFAGALPSMKWK